MDFCLLVYDLLARAKGVIGGKWYNLKDWEAYGITDRNRRTSCRSQFWYACLVLSHLQKASLARLSLPLRDVGFDFYRVFVTSSLSTSVWKIIFFWGGSLISILLLSVLLCQTIVHTFGLWRTQFWAWHTSYNKLEQVTTTPWSSVSSSLKWRWKYLACSNKCLVNNGYYLVLLPEMDFTVVLPES